MLLCLFWKRTTRAACWVSFATGVGLSVLQLVKSMTGFSFGAASQKSFLFFTQRLRDRDGDLLLIARRWPGSAASAA